MVLAMAASSAWLDGAGGFGNGSESGIAMVGGGLAGGCERRGLSDERSGRTLGAAFTAV